MARQCAEWRFAALTAVSEAITRATTPADLLQSVCDAAVGHGEIGCAGVLLVDADGSLRQAAGAGEGLERLRALKLPADPTFNAGEGALIPILRGGSEIGVFAFYPARSGAFSDPAVGLLKRLVENVSSALENFDRGDDRRLADEQKERLTRMFAALSATNEAIMRAATRAELFQLVCEAAVRGGPFTFAIIALAQTGSEFLNVVASAGPNAELAKTLRLAITPEHPEGRGLTGTAFRTRRPCVSNDYLADERPRRFTTRRAVGAANPAPRCRCSAVANRSASCCSFPANSTRLQWSSSNFCSGSRTTSPSRSKTSIGPTNVAWRTSKGNASPGCTPR